MDNKNNFTKSEVLPDNIVRRYQVETISKYTIAGRPLFETSSKIKMSIVCSEIVGNHYCLILEY